MSATPPETLPETPPPPDAPRLGRVARLLIEAMAKHLPPSAAQLRLLDVGGLAGAILTERRADLEVIAVPNDPDAWTVAPESADAVVAYDRALDPPLLRAALGALRPGGRLIVMDSRGAVDEAHVTTLETAGYGRILVEVGAECPLPTGVLMRGEKPHTTADTLARIASVAGSDDDDETGEVVSQAEWRGFRGKYLHVPVIQTPNKPVWAMGPGESYAWDALTLDGALLAFSSLPKAVAFMQPSVLAGRALGVNKVAKFSKTAAARWALPVWLNPPPDALEGRDLGSAPLDPADAEASDEG